MDKFIDGWGRCVYVSLTASVFLIGLGRIELFSSGPSFSAWSISRTTVLFWLIWKLLIWIRSGFAESPFEKRIAPYPLILFFAVITASLIPDFHTFADYRYLCLAGAHALMILDLYSEHGKTRLLVLLLALPPGLLVIRGVIHNPAVFDLSQMIRLGFPLDHPNTAGYLLSMSIPLSVAVFMWETSALRALAAASAAVQTLGLVLTYSRAAWLGFAVAILFLVVALKKWKIALLVLLFAGAALLAAAPALQDRVTSLANPEDDEAIHGRLQIMSKTLQIGLENPLLGVGYGRGRLKELLREKLQGKANEDIPITHAHNVYVGLFAETGILGLLAFVWLLWRPLAPIRPWRRLETNPKNLLLLGVSGAWIAAAVTGVGDVPFYHHETRIYFFSLFALLYVLNNNQAAGNDRISGTGH